MGVSETVARAIADGLNAVPGVRCDEIRIVKSRRCFALDFWTQRHGGGHVMVTDDRASLLIMGRSVYECQFADPSFPDRFIDYVLNRGVPHV